MIIARQSTARTVMVGPVLDATGVAVTDCVVADFEGSVNGGDPAALNGSATLTHRGVGFYSLALTATDLGTVGSFEVTINDTVNACPMKELTVIEEVVYDAFYAASAVGYISNAPVNVAQIEGADPSDTIRDAVVDDATRIDASALNTASTRVATALPNAAPDAAGGLPISDAGGLDLDAQLGTKINDILTDTGTTLDGKLNTAQADLDILTGTGVTLATSQPNYAPATSAQATAIEADTQDIQTRLPAALTSGGNIKADALAVNGSTSAASRLALSGAVLLPGTVDTGLFSATTTEFEADDITEATADHFIGRIAIFTSGALQYQATDITDYALSGSNGHFTVTALTEAPGNNDTFIIV